MKGVRVRKEKFVGFYVSQDQADQLALSAAENDRSVSQQIRHILFRKLKGGFHPPEKEQHETE